MDWAETDRRAVGLFGLSEGRLESVTVTGADITGGFGVGGIVSENRGEVVASCVRDSDVTGGQAVGGLTAINVDGEVVASSVRDSSITGEEEVGGLAGRTMGLGQIRETFVSGVTVTGNNEVGGHTGGIANSSEVSASWATGEITGESRVGGFVGLDRHTVSGSWAACEVTGTDAVGGFVGEHDPPQADEGAEAVGYWNTEVTDQVAGIGAGSGDVTGLTTDEMQGGAAAENMARLDFEETWTAETGPEGYPTLR